MLTRKVTYLQIRVLPYLSVPVKRVTYTCRIGRITLSAAYQKPPAIPDAFKDGYAAESGQPAVLRITRD